MKMRKLIQVTVLLLYLAAVVLVGYGLILIYKPIVFIYFGVIIGYIGFCLFNLLEDLK